MSTVLGINKGERAKKISLGTKSAMYLAKEDLEIVQTLEAIQSELNHVHSTLEHVTEPVLIDSYIYEIKALHLKYQYYLDECKKRGLMAQVF